MRVLRPWRVRAPWRSRVKRSLSVQKMLSIRWRIGARCGPLPGSSLRRGDDGRVAGEHLGVELAAGVALVADHDQRPSARAAVNEIQADVAFVDLRAGERDRAGRAVEREEPVQPEPPEVAAVAAAVPVVGGIGELAGADGFHRAGALHWSGVHDQQVVIKAGAHPGELADQGLDDLCQPLSALPIARPFGTLREQVGEALGGDRQEALVRRNPHERLRHAQRDDLRIGHASSGVLGPAGQEFVRGAEHRNQQQVEVSEHRGPVESVEVV